MTQQIISPYVRVADSNGNPIVGAKLFVYLPGTVTLASIYSDSTMLVALSNPLAGLTGSNANGEFPRAYIAAGTYKLRAETSAGVLLWQEDSIDSGLSSGSGALPITSGADSDDCGQANRLNAATRSDRRRPPFPMKATGLHCRHGDLGQDFFSTSRLAFWAAIFRMLSPLRSRRCAL